MVQLNQIRRPILPANQAHGKYQVNQKQFCYSFTYRPPVTLASTTGCASDFWKRLFVTRHSCHFECGDMNVAVQSEDHIQNPDAHPVAQSASQLDYDNLDQTIDD